MPAVQIKDVPDDVHAVFRRRARAAGQSLQEYLPSTLIAQARQPTLQEIFDEVDRDPATSSARVHSGGWLSWAVEPGLISEGTVSACRSILGP